MAGDWLSDRKQCVVINGKEWEWHNVNGSVSQGSVLSSLLFVIYINGEGINCKMSKFSDDTKIMMNEVTVTTPKLQSDLNEVTRWAEKYI